jgi:mucin type N-acetylglucosaminyltransferase 3
MKIAYGFMVHDRPEQFAWPWAALANPQDVFAIHVDSRVDAATWQAFRRVAPPATNVLYTTKREHVIWGGWGVVSAELVLITELLQADREWSRFINLSAACCPLTDRAARVATLSTSANHVEVDDLARHNDYARTRPFLHAYETADRNIQTRTAKAPPEGFAVEWVGANWHMLTREFCKWLVTDALARRIIDYFRDTRTPDEHLVQCAIMNSPFRDTVANYRRAIFWKDEAYHPETLHMRDLALLQASDALFARKFDIRADGDVLEALARHIGAPLVPKPPQDGVPS